MADFSGARDLSEADSNTADTSNVVPLPVRKRGRPKGSKNKVGAAVREVLKAAGPKVMRQIVRVALGMPSVLSAEPGHKPRRVVPSEASQMAAQKMILDRLEPVLKAVESSGVVSSVNVTIEGDDVALLNGSLRDRARALAMIIPGLKAVKEPEPVEEEPTLDRIIIPEQPVSPPYVDAPEKRVYTVGDGVPVAGGMAIARYSEQMGDGRTKWWLERPDGPRLSAHWSLEECEAKAAELVEKGKI